MSPETGSSPATIRSGIFSGEEFVHEVERLGFSHVVWLPSSGLGPWEAALEQSGSISLVRVCREGEAWCVAAGLYLGGMLPLVVIQSTGLFESGDALRNVLFDLKLPLFAVIGGRSYLKQGSTDTAKTFAEPILKAWGVPYVTVMSDEDKKKLAEHCQQCRQAKSCGTVLIGEGRM